MCDGISKYQNSQTNIDSLTFYYHSYSISLFYLFFREFPDHFDESKLFQGNSDETKKLKIEFRDHFRNISKIMDCVGCDKCKLWGKIQVWYLVCILFIFSKLLTFKILWRWKKDTWQRFLYLIGQYAFLCILWIDQFHLFEILVMGTQGLADKKHFCF